MMSKEFLKSLGILGVTMGLTASPLVLANTHDGDPGSSDPAIDPTDQMESDEREAVPDEALQEPRNGVEPSSSPGTGTGAGTDSDPGSSDPAIDPTDQMEGDEQDPVPDEALQEPRNGVEPGTSSGTGTGTGTESDPGSTDPAIDPTDQMESDERDPVPDEAVQEPRDN